jgi:hypothetical protein
VKGTNDRESTSITRLRHPGFVLGAPRYDGCVGLRWRTRRGGVVATTCFVVLLLVPTPAPASDTTSPALAAARADLQAFVQHTGLVNPSATLADAQSALTALQLQQTAATERGDHPSASGYALQVGKQQQLVFALQSELFTYRSITQRIAAAEQAVRRAAAPLRTRHASSNDSHAAPIITAILVALLALALLVLILLPAPLRRARGDSA